MNKDPSSAAWAAVADAPLGVPIRVRDASGTEATAIRDPYVQWFDENRSSAPLQITPTEWKILNPKS